MSDWPTGYRFGRRTRDGRYCRRCRTLVVGVKGTHGLRNLLSVAGFPFTGGFSLFWLRVSPFRCPLCGARTVRDSGGIAAWLAVLGFVIGVASWLAVVAVAVALTALVLPYRVLRRSGHPTPPERAARSAVRALGQLVVRLGALLETAVTPRSERDGEAPVEPEDPPAGRHTWPLTHEEQSRVVCDS